MQPSEELDVVFSFLRADQALAEEVSALIQGHVKTLCASPDPLSVDRVNRAFRFSARIVAVFYREGWGTTGSSPAHESLIRRRAHEEGFDFVLLIPLDAAPIPEWLPRKQAWHGFSRWGTEGAAVVIESRVEQAGSSLCVENVLEHARRLERDLAWQRGEEEFLRSEEGARSAQSELSKLFRGVETLTAEINAGTQGIRLRLERDETRLILSAEGISWDLAWFSRSPKTLEGSVLCTVLRKGHISLQGISVQAKQKFIQEEFHFDRNQAGEGGWRAVERRRTFLTSSDLAERGLSLLLNSVGAM